MKDPSSSDRLAPYSKVDKFINPLSVFCTYLLAKTEGSNPTTKIEFLT
jgi:hypothetical protein